MSERRFTDTNAGHDSTGRVFGFDGDLYLPLVFAVVTAIGVFALLGLALHISYPLAGRGAMLPLGGTLGWAVLLMHGKPAGSDRDKVDDLLGGGGFTREASDKAHTKTHDRAPNGQLIDGLMISGSPERGGTVAKGFWLEPPDWRGGSFERLNAFQEQVRSLLALVSPGRRLHKERTDRLPLAMKGRLRNVVVAGGRDYALTAADFRFLENALAVLDAQEIFTAGTGGVATQVEAWARSRGIGVQRVVADWFREDPAPISRRNPSLVNLARAVIGFPGDDGTDDLVLKARVRKLPVTESPSRQLWGR